MLKELDGQCFADTISVTLKLETWEIFFIVATALRLDFFFFETGFLCVTFLAVMDLTL